MRTALYALCSLLVWCALVCTDASAEQTIPLRIIAGKLVVKGTLKSPAGEVPAHFILDLGSSGTLILHKNAVEMMGVKDTNILDLSLADIPFKDVQVDPAEDLSEVERLTRDHAGELNEVPAVGIVGRGVFADQAIQLDLPGNAVRIGKIEEFPKSDLPGTMELAYETTSRGLIIPADLPDGSHVRVSFGTRQFETLAEFDAFKNLRIGEADAQPVRIGSIDLLSFAACRASGLPGIPRPLPEIVLGNQLLSRFRILIDQQAGKIRFEPVLPPAPFAAEQAYFVAEQKNDGDAIEKFLIENPDTWLRGEAASGLLELRLGNKTSSETACTKALELFAASLPEDTRSQQMVIIADTVLSAKGGREFAILRKSLELAAQSSGKDLNASAVHQINARRGLLALRDGDIKQARRLLLSAAFGMPGDPKINLWMGDFYRQIKQPARAWSRYVEAALVKDAPIEATRALEELSRDPEFRKVFGITDAELMLEGRLLSYAPPRVRDAQETSAVQLVELFTDGTKPGTVGPQLAFEGLVRFFSDAPVVFVSYHLDPALGNITAGTRRDLYGLMSAPAVVCDGVAIDMNGADDTAAQRLFDTYLKKTAGPTPQSGIDITAHAGWKDTQLQAQVRVKFDKLPADARNLHLYAIVCERCIFALDGNGTGLHYAVARGAMGGPEGLPMDLKPGEQTFDLSIDLSELTRVRRKPATTSASQPTAEAAKGPPWMRPGDPDPRELSIALIVQDASTYKVLRSIQVKPDPAGAPR